MGTAGGRAGSGVGQAVLLPALSHVLGKTCHLSEPRPLLCRTSVPPDLTRTDRGPVRKAAGQGPDRPQMLSKGRHYWYLTALPGGCQHLIGRKLKIIPAGENGKRPDVSFLPSFHITRSRLTRYRTIHVKIAGNNGREFCNTKGSPDTKICSHYSFVQKVYW